MSSSRSSPFHTQTYQVSGNRGRPGKARQKWQDDSKHITEADKHLETGCNPLLKWMGYYLDDKEERTDTNTKAIERIKIGSNQNCIREDLAKEKMVFSQESSEAIFDMSSVELIELKTSIIQCPSCLHYVFTGTTLRRCEKHTRPDLNMTRRI